MDLRESSQLDEISKRTSEKNVRKLQGGQIKILWSRAERSKDDDNEKVRENFKGMGKGDKDDAHRQMVCREKNTLPFLRLGHIKTQLLLSCIYLGTNEKGLRALE